MPETECTKHTFIHTKMMGWRVVINAIYNLPIYELWNREKNRSLKVNEIKLDFTKYS